MGNEIKTRVTLQIADSPRGSWQKMLVVSCPMAYLSSTAWFRQEGADGAVLHFANSGIRPRLVGGKKVFEFDEGLLHFPLQKNTHPVQADAVIRGSTLHIPHIPPEINPPSRFIEVPAPATIPSSGPPVRIMRPIKIRMSQTLHSAFNSYGFCVYIDKETLSGIDRISMKSYGKDGFQLVQDPDGHKVTPNKLSPRVSIKFSQGGVCWAATKAKVKQFEVDAQYDEASRSIICENGVVLLQQKIKEARGAISEKVTDFVERTPEPKTNGVHTHLHPTGLQTGLNLLMAHFHEYEYEKGWSDARIVQEAGVGFDWVRTTREAMTKPVDPKQKKIAALEKQMQEMAKALASLRT